MLTLGDALSFCEQFDTSSTFLNLLMHYATSVELLKFLLCHLKNVNLILKQKSSQLFHVEIHILHVNNITVYAVQKDYFQHSFFHNFIFLKIDANAVNFFR